MIDRSASVDAVQLGPAMPADWCPTPLVVVGSGVAGSGTSVVAALLAIAAAESGRRVLLADVAAQDDVLPKLLRTEPPTPSDRHRNLAVRPLSDTLALGIGVGESTPRELLRGADPEGTDYDLVIADAGNRIATILDACSSGADQFVAVTTLGRTPLAAAFALVKLLGMKAGGLPIQVVFNRDDQAGAREGFAELETAAERFLPQPPRFGGVIPDDECLRAGLAAGMGMFEAATDSPAADAAKTTTRTLLRLLEEKHALRARHQFETRS